MGGNETSRELASIAESIRRLRGDLERNMEESATSAAETARLLAKIDELRERRSALERIAAPEPPRR